ncbi:MAG: TniQ family protein [Euzebyaceae bacterium]|nr:TniQ family protein [Euzebyaceae bacterium]
MKFALGSTTSTPGPSTSRHHLPGLVEEYLSRRDQRRRPHTPTRYCSACLAEDGTWRTTWTSPLHRVCVTHGTYLVDTCHECDQRPFTGTAWAGRDRDPWTCTQHTGRTDGTGRHRRPCAADLRTAQPAPGTSTHLTTQRRLLQLGDNVLDEAPITVCGIATTHLEHAVAVPDLIHEQLPGGLRGDCDPAFLLDAADHALTVLDQPDPATARDTARRLGLGTFQHLFRPTTTTPPKHSASPLLETIVIASVADHLSPTAQLTYRTHSATPRYPAANPAVSPGPARAAPARSSSPGSPRCFGRGCSASGSPMTTSRHEPSPPYCWPRSAAADRGSSSPWTSACPPRSPTGHRPRSASSSTTGSGTTSTTR